MNPFLRQQISEGSSIILQVSMQDLKEVVKSLYDDELMRTAKAIEASREKATLSRDEAARQLGVTHTTLWHWEKRGYLIPVRIGTKVMYRPSDIEEMLTKRKKEE